MGKTLSISVKSKLFATHLGSDLAKFENSCQKLPDYTPLLWEDGAAERGSKHEAVWRRRREIGSHGEILCKYNICN